MQTYDVVQQRDVAGATGASFRPPVDRPHRTAQDPASRDVLGENAVLIRLRGAGDYALHVVLPDDVEHGDLADFVGRLAWNALADRDLYTYVDHERDACFTFSRSRSPLVGDRVLFNAGGRVHRLSHLRNQVPLEVRPVARTWNPSLTARELASLPDVGMVLFASRCCLWYLTSDAQRLVLVVSVEDAEPQHLHDRAPHAAATAPFLPVPTLPDEAFPSRDRHVVLQLTAARARGPPPPARPSPSMAPPHHEEFLVEYRRRRYWVRPHWPAPRAEPAPGQRCPDPRRPGRAHWDVDVWVEVLPRTPCARMAPIQDSSERMVPRPGPCAARCAFLPTFVAVEPPAQKYD